MNCWKCGKEIGDGTRFCVHCGADQQLAPPEDSQQAPKISLEKQETQHNSAGPQGQWQQDGSGPQWQSPQGQYTPPAGGPQWNAASGNHKVVLNIFAGIAAALHVLWGLKDLTGIFGLLAYRYAPALLFLPLSLLTVAANFCMAGILLMIVLKQDDRNADGLLLLLAGGAAVKTAAQFLGLGLTYMFMFGYGSLDPFVRFLTAVLGSVVTVAGVYAIRRYLMQEMPLANKTQEDFKQDVRQALASLGQNAQQAQFDANGQNQQNTQYQQYQYQQQNTQYAYGRQQSAQVPPMGYAAYRLKADRSLIAYILLSIITCNIYSFYFIYALARDTNVVCAGDGSKTAGMLKLMLLSALTCGIYGFYWYYSLGNRLAANAPRYGMNFQENGTTVLLWFVCGSLLCGIGPFLAMHIIIKNLNALCGAYNYSHGI